MRLEAVVVCVNYADFLRETLPENMVYLDRLVVVTSHDDKETRGLCQKYSIDCVPTDATGIDGPFNKARAINLGLGHLRGGDWLLHLDADVVLPHRFRNLLDRASLKNQNLYGCDRVNVRSYEKWREHHPRRHPHYESGYFVKPPEGLPLGDRIVHHEHGYVPIGYFQLWHYSQGKKYPLVQGNAEHTDVLFACQWAREHRVLLPEVYVYHLESEGAPMGTNWGGRKTKPFRPKDPYCPGGKK